MIRTETGIEDLIILEPKVFIDERGYFMESYQKETMSKGQLNTIFIQDNEAKSSYGVIRGLHFQVKEYAQTKLVRCVYGEILDIAVDLRKNSSTFGKVYSIKLSDENKKQLYVPRGFAHGYAVLSPMAIVNYKCDNYYSKENESGIHLFDPTLNIDWQIPTPLRITTEKDISWPKFNELHDELF